MKPTKQIDPFDLSNNPHWAKVTVHAEGISRRILHFADGSRVIFGNNQGSPFMREKLPLAPQPEGHTLAQLFLMNCTHGEEPNWTAVKARLQLSAYRQTEQEHTRLLEEMLEVISSLRGASIPGRGGMTIYHVVTPYGEVYIGGGRWLGRWTEIDPHHPFFSEEREWEEVLFEALRYVAVSAATLRKLLPS